MTDSPDRDSFSSSEMIRRAKDDLSDAVKNSEIDKIMSDLEDIEVAIPVAERYPEPVPRLDTGRSRRPQPAARRVPSSYDLKDDPFDRDDTPVRLRGAIVVALALLVIGTAMAVLFASAS